MTAEQLRAQADAQHHREQLARWCVQWEIPAPSMPVVDAFVAAMKTNQYGVEETWDAFVWFKSGWEAAANRVSENWNPDYVRCLGVVRS